MVGAVEQFLGAEHLVAVFQRGRTVGYGIDVDLVEGNLGGIGQVCPVVWRVVAEIRNESSLATRSYRFT